MQYIAFFLNIPWTICGLIALILSVPRSCRLSWNPVALIFRVRTLWWYAWLPGKSKVRAIVNGHCIQLGPRADHADLAHELIHVEQYVREPFIHPILYMMQSIKYGYRANKYEDEAYAKSGNRYETH